MDIEKLYPEIPARSAAYSRRPSAKTARRFPSAVRTQMRCLWRIRASGRGRPYPPRASDTRRKRGTARGHARTRRRFRFARAALYRCTLRLTARHQSLLRLFLNFHSLLYFSLRYHITIMHSIIAIFLNTFLYFFFK